MPIYKANDKYSTTLLSGYQASPADTVLNVGVLPLNFPTIVTAAKGTDQETVFAVTNGSGSQLTGVTRLRGASVDLPQGTTVECLNNQEFVNQYSTAVFDQNGIGDILYGADGGSSDTYEITLATNPSSLGNLLGVPIVFKANTTNTGDASLEINDLGAITIKKLKDQTLSDGDIKAGGLYVVIYDGTNFQLVNDVSSSGSYTGADDGWISAGETWTYSSNDDPTFTFTISGDKTAKYKAGMYVKLTQTSEKFFIITKDSTYSAPNTTVTLFGGTDYDLANAAISNPYYSNAHTPVGFPKSDKSKWTVSLIDTSDRSESSPANGTWFNLGSLSLSIPIGSWRVEYDTAGYINKSGGGILDLTVTLSTTNNSETDSSMSARYVFESTTVVQHVSRRKDLTLASKTTYYLNARSAQSSVTSIIFAASTEGVPTQIKAVSAYL